MPSTCGLSPSPPGTAQVQAPCPSPGPLHGPLAGSIGCPPPLSPIPSPSKAGAGTCTKPPKIWGVQPTGTGRSGQTLGSYKPADVPPPSRQSPDTPRIGTPVPDTACTTLAWQPCEHYIAGQDFLRQLRCAINVTVLYLSKIKLNLTLIP